MNVYLIKETLTGSNMEELSSSDLSYVCQMNSQEWLEKDSAIWPKADNDFNVMESYPSKAEVSYDSLSGSFSIPDRRDLDKDDICFSFILDEKGIVFIDDTDFVINAIGNIARTKKWNQPSLARFIYDFLDQLCKDDLRLMESFEIGLDEIEEVLTKNETDFSSLSLNRIRGHIRRLLIHYDQLMDIAMELQENENGFFKEEELHYFHKFYSRLERLYSIAESIQDYSVQLRDLYSGQIDMRMNRIMTILTVVTTIFMPLTLLTGWYGMNFRYMPELNWEYSYPFLFCIAICIAVAMLLWFKKKRWL